MMIERAFGALQGRFMHLTTPVRYELSMTEAFILLCFLLHNFVLRSDDRFTIASYDPDDSTDVSVIPFPLCYLI